MISSFVYVRSIFFVKKYSFIFREYVRSCVRNTFFASLDKEFFNHHGIYYSGIISAVFKNITAGEVVAGGSNLVHIHFNDFIFRIRALYFFR
jgi:membrane carboxypeptidase/penicillin-binding protein